jgi:hypothetical protein
MPLQAFVDGIQSLGVVVQRLEHAVLSFLEPGQPGVHLGKKQVNRRESCQLALLRKIWRSSVLMRMLRASSCGEPRASITPTRLCKVAPHTIAPTI